MTCIVGIVSKREKCVVMGADSAGISNYNIVSRKDTKIFKVGDFLIGCTSSFRMIQLLRFSLLLPELPKNKDVYEYMCTDFINAVRKCLTDGGFLEKDKGSESIGQFLVGYKNRLFKVESDLQVGESLDGIYACGCGGDFALAALHSLYIDDKKSFLDLNAHWHITHALNVADKLSAGVCKPFKILSTK